MNGTEIYGNGGFHVGSIDHLMITEQSGKLAYAAVVLAVSGVG
ncbi:hypothetical protein [Pseudorhodobacter aquimaris]